MKKHEKDFEEIWKPLLFTDGELDFDKIRNEMLDLIFVFNQVSEVYSNLTGGKLSKPMYYADTVIGLHEQEVMDAYDEGCTDAKQEQTED